MAKTARWARLCTAAALLAFLPALCGARPFLRPDGPAGERFAAARSAYAAGDFAAARVILERMLPELEETSRDRAFVGSVCLFLGAALEMLGEKNPALASYCRARELLGEGIGCDGLDLTKLRLYREPCPPPLEAVGADDTGDGAGFAQARAAYAAGNFMAAAALLEKLMAAPAFKKAPDIFRGEAFLLSGAVHEKLGRRKTALRHFRRARRILGRGRTIEGLALEDCKYYPNEK
jgi:tetratricopeptide (TPR) repeat protein